MKREEGCRRGMAESAFWLPSRKDFVLCFVKVLFVGLLGVERASREREGIARRARARVAEECCSLVKERLKDGEEFRLGGKEWNA
jgi:hypothetical protein